MPRFQSKKSSPEYELQLEKALLLEQKLKLIEELPHLHGWKWYKWAREFFESTNRMNFLCAANQISKSSSQIRKCIDWATNRDKWSNLWPTRAPLQFWYLYPTRDVATIEFFKKWVVEFLPRGEMKESSYYGWREEIRNKFIYAIHFNSGVSIYFKTYEQDRAHLQTGTCDAVFCDEELPEDLFDELQFRLAATNGYFHMVFTATIGQLLWWQTIEGKGSDEKFRDAWKRQVSMYDCMFYEDGSESPWTEERIAQIISRCKSQAEVQRRVFGRFVKDEGLKYPSFNRSVNVRDAVPIPADWFVYAGVDIGGGGSSGAHPAAIVFVAVSPDYKHARVVRAWRGDGILTTAQDILNKFLELKHGLRVVVQVYDYAAKDFGTIALRSGVPFIQAKKQHDLGEGLLNVAFRYGVLTLDRGDVEIEKLAWELEHCAHETSKTHSRDDLIDALRYAITEIPLNLEDKLVTVEQMAESSPKMSLQEMSRRGILEESVATPLIEDEFEAWNEMYEGW